MTNMKTYPEYQEFLSRNVKRLPVKWKQQGTHVDIEIAGMKFEAICQGFDKSLNEDAYRLSALYGLFVNRNAMTRQQLTDWLMQCLFEMWCSLSSVFDTAAFIDWLAQKWFIEDLSVLPSTITVRADTGVIETGVGVSAKASDLLDADKFHELQIRQNTEDILNRNKPGTKQLKKFEDTKCGQTVRAYVKPTELDLVITKTCQNIQSTCLSIFNVKAGDLLKTSRSHSTKLGRCKTLILLWCMSEHVKIPSIVTYCGYTVGASYLLFKRLRNMSLYAFKMYLNLTDKEYEELAEHISFDKLYEAVQQYGTA